jgi:hypothetical protein
MVREPLAVLVGRRAVVDGLGDVDRVVVSGRGSQTYGFMDTLKDTLKRDFGIDPACVERVETRFLKAAVTMGARLFSLGLCGDFVPSDLSYRNRILLLVRHTGGRVAATELLAPGHSFGGGAIAGPWTNIRPWEQAVVISTWMRPSTHDAENAEAWLLTPRRISAILRGEPLQEIAAVSPYTRIGAELDEFANRAKLAGGLELRACVNIEGQVRLQARPREDTRGAREA